VAAVPWHWHVPGELGRQVILGGDREPVHQLIGHPDGRAGGRGQGQRVPDADRHLAGLSRARRGELDPRSRLHEGAPVLRPGGQRGVQLVDVHAGHCHAGGAQQVAVITSAGSGWG
jgi:hypothetical protein